LHELLVTHSCVLRVRHGDLSNDRRNEKASARLRRMVGLRSLRFDGTKRTELQWRETAAVRGGAPSTEMIAPRWDGKSLLHCGAAPRNLGRLDGPV
jgi:hypothetical protein